jgi:ferrochelatase
MKKFLLVSGLSLSASWGPLASGAGVEAAAVDQEAILESLAAAGKVGVLLASHGDIDDASSELEEYIKVSFQRNPGIPLPSWSRGILTGPAYSLSVNTVRAQYDIIGATNYRANAELQRQAVDEALEARGINGKAYLGYNFTKPYIEETMDEMRKDGVETIVIFNKGAQFSYASSGENMEDALKFLAKEKNFPVKVIGYRQYSDDTRFRKLMADVIERDVKATFPNTPKSEVCVLVASHGLPLWLTDKKDPAIVQMKAAVEAIKAQLPNYRIYHGFLNDDFFPGAKWVAPKAIDLAPKMEKEGCRHILMDGRLSFTNHHRATLYDLNYEVRDFFETTPNPRDTARAANWRKPEVVLAKNFDGDGGYAALIADLTAEAVAGIGPVVTLKEKNKPALRPGAIGKPGVDPYFTK